mmetsp:Transcript_336/g.1172  ORF Transcript_336/g.1172 Transcript_336/m.1172 type:complete len:172 (-) Transcript_336:59-574(-)
MCSMALPSVNHLFEVADKFKQVKRSQSADCNLSVHPPYAPEQQVRRFRSFCEQQRRNEEDIGAYSLLLAANAMANAQQPQHNASVHNPNDISAVWPGARLLNCTQNYTHVVTSNQQGVTGLTVSQAAQYTLASPDHSSEEAQIQCTLTQTVSYRLAPCPAPGEQPPFPHGV